MAIDTAKSEAKPGFKFRWTWGSRLGRTIIALNVAGLLVLVTGALILNETRRALVNSNLEALTAEADTFGYLIARAATMGEPEPILDAEAVRRFIFVAQVPETQRLRIFDGQGNLIADSFNVVDRIERRDLPRLRRAGGIFKLHAEDFESGRETRDTRRALAALEAETKLALKGELAMGPRPTFGGDRVLSVSVPIKHVTAVTGVLTLEAGDVDEIIQRERAALAPFVALAVLATFASSVLLNFLVADPVRRLSRAADKVRMSQARAISLPEIARRDDELGDLARSLETMTHTLSERMDAIERFAADVAHEIRNPLTSIRSAVETLDLVKDPKAREKLMGILRQDVGRLDRLITDISNASRLDAELSRDTPRPVELDKLAADIVGLYPAGPKAPRVVLDAPAGPYAVLGREGPLAQVLRNLIDNARSFTAETGKKGASVRVAFARQKSDVLITVEDDGPGIPEENLETVFERFYTSRPKSASGVHGFGGNSGLGLSIARQIIQAHNGRVWAENRRTPSGGIEGARFTIILPAAPELKL